MNRKNNFNVPLFWSFFILLPLVLNLVGFDKLIFKYGNEYIFWGIIIALNIVMFFYSLKMYKRMKAENIKQPIKAFAMFFVTIFFTLLDIFIDNVLRA